VSIVESLKRLFDPAAARQEEAERRADREKPIREDAGPDKWFECRVCHYLGTDPTFCPKCLAGTMRPTRARPAPAEAAGAAAATPTAGAADEASAARPAPDPAGADGDAGDAPDATGEPAATALPFDGTLDLHTFAPKEVRDLLPEYLAGCQERGQRQVRIIHGKGTGALRRSVHALLRRDPRVESFRSAAEDAGGWGATLVTLRPA
jgi:DNA-nicking Smr family endonuclease